MGVSKKAMNKPALHPWPDLSTPGLNLRGTVTSQAPRVLLIGEELRLVLSTLRGKDDG